jgi:superfamily II DNA or RNA helicase
VQYQGKAAEVLATRKTFGRSIAQIRILATGQILDVPADEVKEYDSEVSMSELVFKAMASRIWNEVSNQKILAPFESNVIPLPHQILALEKVMSGAYLRFLLADEVGMGKTIETGLALKELKLRGIVKRTLIIVPLSAMLQWRNELKQHFNETFHIYDSEYINTITRTFTKLEADNEINIWSQHNQLIVSMDALKPIENRQGWSRERVEEYNRHRIENVLDAEFDLLIIDECHKVGGSSTQVGRFQMSQILCNAIPNVLLLSATPHRGKSDHFRRILGLLDGDAFSGEGVPSIAELEPYVVRTEKRQAIDYTGKPLFNERITERVIVPYNDAAHRRQKALYEDVTEYVVTGFNLAKETSNTSYGFVMILFQRMMSSSTQAIHDAMERRADRLQDEQNELSREQVANDLMELGYSGQIELDFEAKITAAIEGSHQAYATELEILTSLIRQAKECISHERDVKLEYLIARMAEMKRLEENPELKYLIFTEFTSTQIMLKRELEQRGGYVCEAINGSMCFEDRVEALKMFKDKAQVLVTTDAAGESLNMQFAHIVFNYDMPWNPMVLEQRIGRVDRIGQTHIVKAINLMLDNSIDERVYEVIETKLDQIMLDLGIDKTSDVLDSTLERESISRLFLTSLLDPKRFQAESDNWLNDIKSKLTSYKSTEGALPTLDSSKIRSDKTDAIRHSPLPSWLEILSCSFLEANNLSYRKTPAGFETTFPGHKENIYTFNTKEGLENPIQEPLTLQHEIIQSILAEAIPISEGNPIPIIRMASRDAPNGFWTLWTLRAANTFESHELTYPLYFSDEGDIFTAYAQNFWVSLSSNELNAEILKTQQADHIQVFQDLIKRAEGALGEKYTEMEQGINENTIRLRANKEKAFDFQERQIGRIGIETIRKYRMQRLFNDRQHWTANFDSAAQVIPSLACRMILRVVHE